MAGHWVKYVLATKLVKIFGGNIIETGTDSYRLATTRACAEQHLATS